MNTNINFKGMKIEGVLRKGSRAVGIRVQEKWGMGVVKVHDGNVLSNNETVIFFYLIYTYKMVKKMELLHNSLSH